MNQTVLLVEDDENDVFFMQRAFKEAVIATPLNVVIDGNEAIEYLSGNGKYADRQKWALPYLVLLDLKLPRVLGLDVLKWIRSKPEFAGIIVVILTSSKEDVDVRIAYERGANSYLVKPTDAQRLGEMVNRIKQYWFELNQPAPQAVEIERAKAIPPQINKDGAVLEKTG